MDELQCKRWYNIQNDREKEKKEREVTHQREKEGKRTNGIKMNET